MTNIIKRSGIRILLKLGEVIDKSLDDLLLISKNVSMIIHNVRDIIKVFPNSSIFVEIGSTEITILNPINLSSLRPFLSILSEQSLMLIIKNIKIDTVIVIERIINTLKFQSVDANFSGPNIQIKIAKTFGLPSKQTQMNSI